MTTKEFLSKYRTWILLGIIVFMTYTLYFELKAYRSGWESYDKEALINKCISTLKNEMGLKTYDRTPSDVKDYCECSTEIIQNTFSKTEYLEFVGTKKDSSSIKAIQLMGLCLTQYESIRELFLQKYNDTPTPGKASWR